jgi:hypothetical protein
MQATAKGGAPATIAALVATSLITGDQILVTLTAEKQGGERVSLSYAFDDEGQQVNNKGEPIGGRSLAFNAAATGAEPVFPTEEYTAALIRGQQGGAPATDRIIASFKDSMEQYQNSGGAPATDRIAASVFSFLEQEQNVKATDHNGLVLKPEEVVVRAPVRRSQDEPGVWLVQLAPTWGF